MKIPICLCAMLKDEEKNIAFMLDRYQPKPAVVAVNINNTTDNTREVLRDYCKKHNIKLYIKESKFYNYAANRNIAMEFAYEAIRSYYNLCPTGPMTKQELLTPEHNDDLWYIHMVDADNLTLDDKITGVTNDNYTTMDLGTVNLARYVNNSIPKGKKEYPDSFNMTILGGTKYSTNNMFKVHLSGYNGVIYLCPLHEVSSPKCWSAVMFDLKGCYISRGQRGARSRDSYTYMKDALMISQYLSEGLIAPGDKSRMTFYCAQSFKDSMIYNEAVTYYHRRGLDERGYLDERFMSYLNLFQMIDWIHVDGRSPYTKDELDLKKLEYISNAHELIPHRLDALVPLFNFYYFRKLYKIAWSIAKPYARLYEPPNGLFVDTKYYNNPDVLENFIMCAHLANDDVTAKDIISHVVTMPPEKFKPGHLNKIIGYRSLLK